MGSSSFLRTLIDHEIRHHVAMKAKNGGMLRSSTVVDAIMRAYPKCDVSPRELEDMVILAAGRACVPIEMGQLTRKVRRTGRRPKSRTPVLR
jgi:hypothetical protein